MQSRYNDLKNQEFLDIDNLKEVCQPEQALSDLQGLGKEEGDCFGKPASVLKLQVGAEDLEKVVTYPFRKYDAHLLMINILEELTFSGSNLAMRSRK